MNPPLWQHQLNAIDLATCELTHGRGGFGLWHDMATGKTRTAIEIAILVGAQRVLVVCPANVIATWVEQIAEYWMPTIDVRRLDVDPRKRAAILASPLEREVVIINYESMWRTPSLLKGQFDLVIYDEAHRCKMPSGKQARFGAKLSTGIPLRLGLSGTPTPHSPLDAWSVVRLLTPTSPLGFQTYTQFRSRYLRPATYAEFRDRDLVFSRGRGGDLQRFKMRDLDDLHERIYRIGHRVLADDVVERPEPQDHAIEVDLEPAAIKLYRELERELTVALGENTVDAANAMVLVLRLAQLTGGTLRPEGAASGTVVSTAKEKALAAFLEDAGGEPVVAFARFHSDLDAVARACDAAGVTRLELSGRVRELEAWQAGGAQVLIAQVASGSEGVDLTRARLAVFYSVGYSLGQWLQARARIHRPNSKHKIVAYYSLIARGTVDEDVYRALSSRREVIDALIESHASTRQPGQAVYSGAPNN